jgi:hypothetical protein
LDLLANLFYWKRGLLVHGGCFLLRCLVLHHGLRHQLVDAIGKRRTYTMMRICNEMQFTARRKQLTKEKQPTNKPIHGY